MVRCENQTVWMHQDQLRTARNDFPLTRDTGADSGKAACADKLLQSPGQPVRHPPKRPRHLIFRGTYSLQLFAGKKSSIISLSVTPPREAEPSRQE